MRVFFTVLIFLLFVSSCKNDKGPENIKTTGNEELLQMDWFIRKFSLPYDRNLVVDSNTLIFYKSKYFDTSYLINIQKRDTAIYGVYYEVLPEYHKSVDHYLDQNMKLIYFQGYSFQISDSSWNLITSEISPAMTANDSTHKNNEACYDCPHYFLSYAFKTGSSSNLNRTSFDTYALFLKEHLLNQLKSKRPALGMQGN
ncbi:MAG: hypothetical protein KF862_24650 [Chitinophagaceae bacterium]|nr:hypothetical protein [Chitinophagaceae bacterium]